ncbi:hypothetical protein F7D09_0701 [Bifidobacterium leontopitheci]|uniref:Uncharacterized protein n=2 Tax=Bifidobacterium leontopitheci TaxID=2650774 RepID=A0A6I1GGR3_9BIFI|nr:hypothetical protein F7D09_0701 [Bifidobacterium leontopitheci]
MTGYQQNGPQQPDGQPHPYRRDHGDAARVHDGVASAHSPATSGYRNGGPAAGGNAHGNQYGPYPPYGGQAQHRPLPQNGPWRQNDPRQANGPWQSSGPASPYSRSYGQPYGGGPYYRAQVPVSPHRGLSGAGIAAIITATLVIPALLFLLIAAGISALSHNDSSTTTNSSGTSTQTPRRQQDDDTGGSADNRNNTDEADPTPVYRMDERPGYDTLVDYIDGKLAQYKEDILGDPTMFMIRHRIPDTQEGSDYMTGFAAALLGISNDIKDNASTTSEDPTSLDEKIERYRTTIDTIEARFNKGEALGVTMDVTGNDGKQYAVDGSKSIQLAPSWDEREKQVASAPNNLGNGNAASAQKLVERAGMTLSWNIDEGFRQCPGFVGTDNGSNKALAKSETFGFYCPSTPNVIYGNRDMADWNMTYAPAAGVRHEISHHAIHVRCGTIEPSVVMQNGVNRAEGVTNSYAVRYMGADRTLIQQSIDYARSNGHNQYAMDSFTDHAADLIHNGQCQTN